LALLHHPQAIRGWLICSEKAAVLERDRWPISPKSAAKSGLVTSVLPRRADDYDGHRFQKVVEKDLKKGIEATCPQ